MAVARNIALALLLAGMLTGCSLARWFRGDASNASLQPVPADQKPIAVKSPRAAFKTSTEKANTESVTIPENPPALYIAGSAGPPRPKEIAALPTALPAQEKKQEPETTLPPLTPADPAISDRPLRVLADRAALRWSVIDGYACRIRRREAVSGQPKPEELLVAKFRKEPYSVYFQFIGGEAKGREVVYVKGQHGNLIHTLTAAGDIPLVSGGSRFKIAPDSLLVKNRSRYSITEAGIGTLIERFGKLVQAVEQGDVRAGTVKYLGQAKRTEFDHKVEVVLHHVPSGWDPLLPSGGKRLWCFDPDHGLPALIVTYDHLDREVEYYCHDRFEFPGRFGDDEFDPDRLWPKRQ